MRDILVSGGLVAARRKARGRPILGAVSGLFFGGLVGLDLWLVGFVRLDSPTLIVLPLVGVVLGVVLGFAAPIRRRVASAAVSRATPGPAGGTP